MLVKIHLIIKGLESNGALKILLEDNRLPSFVLEKPASTLNAQIYDFILTNFEIPKGFVDFSNSGIEYRDQEHIDMFFTSFAPMDFLNEKTSKKFSVDYSILGPKYVQQVRQAIQVFRP